MSEDFKNISWPGWETVRLIGRGSFGAVYEIERKVFDETEKAALKVISIPQNSGDIDDMYSDGYDEESITSTFKSHLQSIVAEYSLMRKMNGSANIVNCDDVRYIQHDDGIGWDIFIKMELLTPLTKALSGNVDEEIVIKIAKDMCGALELCKKHGIVHRDIKPQNIFVSEHGDYKLGDFGIAKTVEKTMGGTKIGTYKYMAPEVYNNQPYGSGADIYSLGLVLYWLLNERRMPFMPLPPEKLKAGVEESSRHRRLSGEKLPEPAHGSKRLKQIVLKACAYDPKERYQTATEMLQDIDSLFGLPVKPEQPKPEPPVPPEPKPEPPVPPTPPQPEREKKSKLPIILGIAAVIVIVIILLLLRSCDNTPDFTEPTESTTDDMQIPSSTEQYEENTQPGDNKLVAIAISAGPSKTYYYVGETLNTSGLTLTATYNNGKTETITSGFTCTPSKLSSSGTQNITVRYGGQSTTFSVNVTAVSISSISVRSKTSKTYYYVGETLNTSGLTLTATYNNGKTETITSGFTCTPSKLSSAGTQNITVSYGGKTATFSVNVTAVSVSSISVKTKPGKTSYYVGDTLNTSGLTLTATYNNGTTKTISSGFSCSPTTLSTAGPQTVTVNFEGKKTTFSVSVEAVYTVSWNTGTGYSIAVRRTSSSNANAPTGTLDSGSAIYCGDVLSISYAASTGYTLTGQGSTSITVTGNVTSSNIYASAKVNSYTYNVVYVSSNGTSLGSSTVTYNYGTQNTISAPAKSGYTTPSSQSVKWDSTSAKTISFTYTPKSVSFTTKTGQATSLPAATFSAEVRYRNRTATSIEMCIVWTETMPAYSWNTQAHKFDASFNGVSAGRTTIASYYTWQNAASYARSQTGVSAWVTVPVDATTTSVSVSVQHLQTNIPGTVLSWDYSGTWIIAIPTY